MTPVSCVLLKEKTGDSDDKILFDPIILKTKHAFIPRIDVILTCFIFFYVADKLICYVYI